jgi:hypothetical protein
VSPTPTAPSMSMAHPARRVMPNGPVGRKLQNFKYIPQHQQGARRMLCLISRWGTAERARTPCGPTPTPTPPQRTAERRQHT